MQKIKKIEILFKGKTLYIFSVNTRWRQPLSFLLNSTLRT
jgi:hypothetical protein